MSSTESRPAVQSLRQDLAVVLVFWTLVTLGLVLSSVLDARRSGNAISVVRAASVVAPLMLPQVCFSTVVAWVLHRQPHWLNRPLLLLAGAWAAIPVYLALATPAVVAIGLLTRSRPWADFNQAFGDWAAMNIWVDAMMASAGMAVQIGWAFWRHAQRQREAALYACAENLNLRLTLLQGQLEPHFLFNTLNGIAALVRGAEREVALLALSRLSELLRYALRASQQRWVSVADELRFVDDYVALQRLRFGASLQWLADIEPADWARWACPPLLLQPLAENAIRHGLESGLQGALQLHVQRHGGTLQVTLDNPHDPTAALLPGHGVGLSKTRERLYVLYGDRAQLQTDVASDRFRLRLSMPLEDLDVALEAPGR